MPSLLILKIKPLGDLNDIKTNNPNEVSDFESSPFYGERENFRLNVLGMPETSFNGRRTRMARSVRKLTLAPSSGNSAIILCIKISQITNFQSKHTTF